MRPIDTRAAATPPRAARASIRRGFTLIEIMIVIALIAIVSTIALPKLNLERFRVDAGARLVRITLQAAQRQAVARQFDVVVSFDLANNTMRVLEDNNNNDAVDPGEHVVWHPLEDDVRFATPPVGIDGPVGAPIGGANVRTIDGMPSIVFRRDGAASTNLEVYLTSARGEPDDFRAVRVVQATGRTEWQKYVGGAWKAASL